MTDQSALPGRLRDCDVEQQQQQNGFSACTMLNNTSSGVVTSIALASRRSVETDNCF
jgi:hypothetical protein